MHRRFSMDLHLSTKLSPSAPYMIDHASPGRALTVASQRQPCSRASTLDASRAVMGVNALFALDLLADTIMTTYISGLGSLGTAIASRLHRRHSSATESSPELKAAASRDFSPALTQCRPQKHLGRPHFHAGCDIPNPTATTMLRGHPLLHPPALHLPSHISSTTAETSLEPLVHGGMTFQELWMRRLRNRHALLKWSATKPTNAMSACEPRAAVQAHRPSSKP